MFDLEKVRAETKYCNEVVHLNNAGASLMPDRVFNSVVDHLELERKVGGYEAAAIKTQELNDFYNVAARAIDAESDEIAFCDSATRAMNTILYGIDLKPGDKVFASCIDFGSNIVALTDICARSGAVLQQIPAEPNGTVCLEKLAEMIDENTKLVAISHAPAQGAAINPIEEVGKLTKASNALYLVDCCQTVGQLPISVRNIQCDALVTTGRKWIRGPRGTGFAFIRRAKIKQLHPPTIDLANSDWLLNVRKEHAITTVETAKKFEIWERSMAGMLGLREALLYMNEIGLTEITHRTRLLARRARTGLRAIPHIALHDDGEDLTATIAMSSSIAEAEKIKESLKEKKINVSVLGSWDAPWDFIQRKLPTMVRISPHYYNSEAEIDRLLEILAGLKN